MKINSFFTIYSKNQNFLSKPYTKSLANAYFEVKKEKKSMYLKHYKRLLKLKVKKTKNFGDSYSFLNTRLQKLNINLTKKKLNDLSFLNSSLIYKNFKQTKFTAKNLKGY